MSIFYKITSAEGKSSYLFGTYHVSDEEIVTLPFEVKQAFDNATQYVFEADVETLDSQTASHLASQKSSSFDEAIILMGEAVDPSRLKNILDQQLLTKARSTNKKIMYLDSMESLLKLFFGLMLNREESEIFYKFVLAQSSKGKKFPGFDDTVLAYLKQDLQELKNCSEPFHGDKNVPEPVRRYYKAVYSDRDISMADSLKPILNTGNAFIAVGAAHLVGVTSKLKNEGYLVENK